MSEAAIFSHSCTCNFPARKHLLVQTPRSMRNLHRPGSNMLLNQINISFFIYKETSNVLHRALHTWMLLQPQPLGTDISCCRLHSYMHCAAVGLYCDAFPGFYLEIQHYWLLNVLNVLHDHRRSLGGCSTKLMTTVLTYLGQFLQTCILILIEQ